MNTTESTERLESDRTLVYDKGNRVKMNFSINTVGKMSSFEGKKDEPVVIPIPG